MSMILRDRVRKRREEEDDDMMLFFFPALSLLYSNRGGEKEQRHSPEESGEEEVRRLLQGHMKNCLVAFRMEPWIFNYLADYLRRNRLVLDTKIKTFPKIVKFRNNKASFPLYDTLGELYDGRLAEGTHNCTSLDSVDDEEPLRLVPELEEAESEETDLLDDPRITRDEETPVEESRDCVLLDEPPREEETPAEESRGLTEAQRRKALIEKKRQENEAKKAKKASKNSRVEIMMERYLGMRTKQVEDEVAAREKEGSQATDYSFQKCVSVLSTMDVTKQEKAKAYAVFKTPANREAFLCACNDDLESALIWLRSEMA